MAARVGRRMLAMFACGLLGFAGETRSWAAETKNEVVDAEMLKDLDLLREVNVAREGELLQRMRFWERFRLLERLRVLEETIPADPAAKEEK